MELPRCKTSRHTVNIFSLSDVINGQPPPPPLHCYNQRITTVIGTVGTCCGALTFTILRKDYRESCESTSFDTTNDGKGIPHHGSLPASIFWSCDQTFLRKIWKRVRWQECGKTTFFYSASFRLVQNKIRFAIGSREWICCSTQILLYSCLIRAAHPVATLQLMRPQKPCKLWRWASRCQCPCWENAPLTALFRTMLHPKKTMQRFVLIKTVTNNTVIIPRTIQCWPRMRFILPVLRYKLCLQKGLLNYTLANWLVHIVHVQPGKAHRGFIRINFEQKPSVMWLPSVSAMAHVAHRVATSLHFQTNWLQCQNKQTWYSPGHETQSVEYRLRSVKCGV